MYIKNHWFTQTKRKTVKDAYRRYMNGNRFSLECCYKNPSLHKQMAYRQCELTRLECGGICGGVVSYNTHQFTYGFIVYLNGNKYFCLITAYNTYVMGV